MRFGDAISFWIFRKKGVFYKPAWGMWFGSRLRGGDFVECVGLMVHSPRWQLMISAMRAGILSLPGSPSCSKKWCPG